MKLAGMTDIGCVRTENQDNYRAARLDEDMSWALVCDGMGGTNGGRLASKTAAAVFEKAMIQLYTNSAPKQDIREFLLNTVKEMNQTVFKIAMASREYAGMGTTMVAAVVYKGVAHVVHVGDSRAYLCRNHQLKKLTKDHSMVQQLIEEGKITEQEAGKHPNKNLITRAIGVNVSVQPDYGKLQLSSGDLLMLCTDGLYNQIAEQDMVNIIETTPYFECPNKLIREALRTGGQDNITAVLMATEPGEIL